jgi:hypothetical protein
VTHHKIALLVVAAALALDAACGVAYAAAEHITLWLGLYNALANAVTLGGDVPPSNGWGHLVDACECFTVIPLFAATLSLFTSGLTEMHVVRAEHRIRQHIDRQGDA